MVAPTTLVAPFQIASSCLRGTQFLETKFRLENTRFTLLFAATKKSLIFQRAISSHCGSLKWAFLQGIGLNGLQGHFWEKAIGCEIPELNEGFGRFGSKLNEKDGLPLPTVEASLEMARFHRPGVVKGGGGSNFIVHALVGPIEPRFFSFQGHLRRDGTRTMGTFSGHNFHPSFSFNIDQEIGSNTK